MSFYKQITQLIQQCNNFQQEVEKNELLFKEPYQSKYLAINKVLIIHKDKRVAIEAVAAGNQTAPGVDDFSDIREEYYELEKVIPPFLAGERQIYWYLQTYKIRCKFMLKMFSYSTFKGDWGKIRNVQNWLVAIYKNQEKYDAESSIKQSLKELKELGDFEKLDHNGLQRLQEEVENIHSLLAENPALQEGLSAEDAELLQSASQYLKDNEDLLEALPPIEDFEFEESPVLEVIANRCKQLSALVDDFPDDCEKGTEVIELYDFKQELKDSFDLKIPICADIHAAMVKAIGSHKSPSIKALCRMLRKSLKAFADEDLLTKHYGDGIFADNSEVENGIPDTLELELILITGIGGL